VQAILVLLALMASLAFPSTRQDTAKIAGKVIGISDGGTITILTQDMSSVKIRLEGIDAPESNQAFGSKAKDTLKALVGGKTVEVEKSREDRYGRTLGFVVVDGINVNAKLLEDGWA
jgi:micrococcal nuclease